MNVSPKSIEQVVYFARYLVLDVLEKKRIEAKNNLEAVKKAREKELSEDFNLRKKELQKESLLAKEKAKKRIKNLQCLLNQQKKNLNQPKNLRKRNNL